MTPQTRNRLKLIAIAAVGIAPILGSYLLYWFWLPAQQTNYGALVTPRPVPEARTQLLDGTSFTLGQLRGRWIMVAVDSGECGSECRENLWKMRQVRLTQGKEMGRIERVWIVSDDRAPAAELLAEHGGLWVVRAGVVPLLAAFEAPAVRGRIFLVDPQGYVMMRFPANAEPRGMVKDLGRLLKYSRTG